MLDPEGPGRFHERAVSSDGTLEADEAPIVPIRRGELDRLVEEARVVEELAGNFDGVPDRREGDELEHATLRGLRYLRDRESRARGARQEDDPAAAGPPPHGGSLPRYLRTLLRSQFLRPCLTAAALP